MNVKLLRKVKKHILEEPKRYNQNSYLTVGKHKVIEAFGSTHVPACNTVGCIAGWALVLSSTRPPRRWLTTDYRKARNLLGLNGNQFMNLCGTAGDWPNPFADAYYKAVTDLQRAKIAAERIEHFIKTKGEE